MAVRVIARTPAQTFALVFGIVYLAFGLLGFAVTGWSNPVRESGVELFLFELNPLHNVAHIVFGIVWLVAADDHQRSKRVNVVLGGIYVVLALLGVVGLLDSILSANAADHFLHVATGLLALFFGTIGGDPPRGVSYG